MLRHIERSTTLAQELVALQQPPPFGHGCPGTTGHSRNFQRSTPLTSRTAHFFRADDDFPVPKVACPPCFTLHVGLYLSCIWLFMDLSVERHRRFPRTRTMQLDVKCSLLSYHGAMSTKTFCWLRKSTVRARFLTDSSAVQWPVPRPYRATRLTVMLIS